MNKPLLDPYDPLHHWVELLVDSLSRIGKKLMPWFIWAVIWLALGYAWATYHANQYGASWPRLE